MAERVIYQTGVDFGGADKRVEKLTGLLTRMMDTLKKGLRLNVDSSQAEKAVEAVSGRMATLHKLSERLASQLQRGLTLNVDDGKAVNTLRTTANLFDKNRAAAQQNAAAQQKALAAMELAGQRGTAAFAKQEQAVREASAEVRKYDTALSKAGAAGAPAVGGLAGILGNVQSKLGGVIGMIPGLGGLSSGLGAAASAGLKTALVLGGIGLAAAGIGKAIQAGAEFEETLRDMQSIIGSTDAVTQQLGDRARATGKAFNISGVEGVESFKLVISALGPAVADNQQALQSMATSVLTFAKAGGLEGAEATKALTVTLSQFGFTALDAAGQAEQMARISNVLAAAAQEGAAEIPDLSESMKVAGATAKAANISVEQTAALLEALAPAGIKGAEAGTAVRNMILKLSTGTKMGADELAKLGLTFADINPEKVGIVKSLETLRDKFVTIQDPVQKATALKKLFGLENANAATLLMTAAGGLDAFTEKITGTNVAQEQAQIKMSTFSEQLKGLGVRLQDIAIIVFDALRPALGVFTDMAGAVLLVVGPIAEFAAKNAVLVTTVGTGVLIWTKWSSIVGTVTKLGSSLVGFVIKQVTAMGLSAAATATDSASKTVNAIATGGASVATIGFGASLKALFVTMLANPFFLVTAGLIAIGVGLAALLSGGESGKEAMEGVTEAQENLATTLTDTKASDTAAQKNLDLADSYDLLKTQQAGLQAALASGELSAEDAKAKMAELHGASKELNVVAQQLAKNVPETANAIGLLGEASGDGTSGIEIDTARVRELMIAQGELNATAKEGALLQVAKENQDLAEAYKDSADEAKGLNEDLKKLEARKKSLQEQPKTDGFFGNTAAIEQQMQSIQSQIDKTKIKVGELVQGEGDEPGIAGMKTSLFASADAMKGAGASVDQIKTSFGDNVDLAKEWEASNRANEASQAAQATNINTVTGLTGAATDKATELSDEWKEQNETLQAQINTHLQSIALIELRRRQGAAINADDAAGDEQRRKDLARMAGEFKQMNSIIEELKKQFGLTEPKAAKAAKTIRKLAGDITSFWEKADEGMKKITDDRALEAATSPFAKMIVQLGLDRTAIIKNIEDLGNDAQGKLDDVIKNLNEGKGPATFEFKLALNDEEARAELKKRIPGLIDEGNELIAKNQADAQKLVNEVKTKGHEFEVLQLQQANDRFIAEQRNVIDERLEVIRDGQKLEFDLLKQRTETQISFLTGSQDRLEKALFGASQTAQRDPILLLIGAQTDARVLKFEEGQKRLRDVRAAGIERDRQAALEAAAEETAAFVASRDRILTDQKGFQDDYARQLLEKSLTEEQYNELSAELARDTAELIAAERQRILLSELADTNSRAFLLNETFNEQVIALDKETADKRVDIQKSALVSILQENLFLSAALDFRAAAFGAHIDILTDEAQRGAEERQKALDEESDKNRQTYLKGEQDFNAYIGKLADINKQRAELESDLTTKGSNFFTFFNQAAAEGFKASQQKLDENLTNQIGSVGAFLLNREGKEKEFEARRAALDLENTKREGDARAALIAAEATKDTGLIELRRSTLEAVKSDGARTMDELSKEQEGFAGTIGKSLTAAGAEMVNALGSALVTSQNVAKAGANAILDIAFQQIDALLTTFIFQTLGTSLGMFGPILGPIIAGLATAGLKGLAGLAKSAISGAKFKEGGLVTGGMQRIWVNEDGRKEYVASNPMVKSLGLPFLEAVRHGEHPFTAAAKFIAPNARAKALLRFGKGSASPIMVQAQDRRDNGAIVRELAAQTVALSKRSDRVEEGVSRVEQKLGVILDTNAFGRVEVGVNVNPGTVVDTIKRADLRTMGRA